MKRDKQQLPDLCMTVQDVSHCIRNLSEYKNWLHADTISSRIGIATRKSEPIILSDTAQSMLDGIPQPSAMDVQSAIQSLEKVLAETPVIKVVIAAPLTTSGQRSIVRWFRALTGKMVLCNFATDSAIAGGVVVYTPTRMFDYSYATQVKAKLPLLHKELHRG